MPPQNPQSLSALDESLAELVTPFNTDQPCGSDPRHEPAFLSLREQASARERPNALPTDWNKVGDTATKMLGQQSKDLRVATFLATSYIHESQVQGLAQGLRLIFLLFRAHGEAMFPLARKGQEIAKVRALQWFADAAPRELSKQDIKNTSEADFDSAFERLDDLDALCTNEFGEKTISWSSLRSALGIAQSRLRSAQAPKPAIKLPDPTPVASSQEAISIPSSQQEPWLPPLEILRTQAHQLRELRPAQPLSYLLLRSAIWTPIEAAPSSDAAGRCQVPLPTQQERKSLEELERLGQWPGLLERCENLMCNYPLCLSLQRLSVAALKGIPDRQAAVDAIEASVIALLHRMPTLPTLKGANGEALADQETRAWIQAELIAAPQPSSVPVSAEDELSWFESLASIPKDEVPRLLKGLQECLDSAPDRLSFAKRAIFAARRLSHVRGLTPLLGALARNTLGRSGDPVVCKSVERECWELMASAPGGPQTVLQSHILGVARVDLQMALDRLTAS